MELTAAVRALESLAESCSVELFTDSRYVQQGITKWLAGWIRNGWKRRDGEVKNVYVEEPARQERQLMTRAYREKLEAYAAATGGQLKLAIYWARWAIWTLVSPERLADVDGILTLDMPTAMRANELGRLGDRTIGTRPPLRLQLIDDPHKTSPVAPDAPAPSAASAKCSL